MCWILSSVLNPCLSVTSPTLSMPDMDQQQTLWGRISVWLATGIGVGLVSPAPGTIGGLWGLPLAMAIGGLSPFAQQVTTLLVVLISIVLCSVAARMLGGSKDPQAIVLDEIAALPIVYLGVWERTPAIWIAGFLLFRLFDITKPWPARQAERLPSGLGIMADDCVAAVYACLSLHMLVWLEWLP